MLVVEIAAVRDGGNRGFGDRFCFFNVNTDLYLSKPHLMHVKRSSYLVCRIPSQNQLGAINSCLSEVYSSDVVAVMAAALLLFVYFSIVYPIIITCLQFRILGSIFPSAILLSHHAIFQS
jgi:hypothetical protein